MSGVPSQSVEDYLERIHELSGAQGRARVGDIAASLRVTRASVTGMIQKLDEQGYLHYRKYRGVVLTEAGRRVALQVRRRHETLARFFSVLGLDIAIQHRDIEGLEHHLSPATLSVLADLARFLEADAAVLEQFRQFRALGEGGPAEVATIRPVAS